MKATDSTRYRQWRARELGLSDPERVARCAATLGAAALLAPGAVALLLWALARAVFERGDPRLALAALWLLGLAWLLVRLRHLN